MAQKYYNVKEASQVFGITEEAVRQMLERRELHGYRDGADWKFKSEDIERMAAGRKSQPAHAIEDTDEVLLSEVELGQSGTGASGTVIGMETAPRAESDIHLAESDVDVTSQSVTPPIGKAQPDSKVGKFEELDLGMAEDLTLAESNIGLDAAKKPSSESPTGSSSLAIASKPSDDDEAVIGGGSSGSGITLSGDSGISLVDPADSGLSLEEPLELGASGAGESLELGEEDLLQLAESSKSHSGLKADDDFLLTPTEETAEADESESGSQVIALDTEGDEAATLVSPGQGMATIFGEALGGQPGLDMGAGVALGPAPLGAPGLGASAAAVAEGAAVTPAGAFFPEAPYSTWNIVFLSLCLFFLLLCGAMVYDLLRNMWSWNSAGSVNTWLMDTIVGLFEK
ncbi:MAG: helix-turn-helix domain-containing protein [Thermoguttaceae bacterium]|jgi:excisionase family DNA binding protein